MIMRPDLTKRFFRLVKTWGFPVIYLGWAYLFWSPIFASEESVWSFPKVLFFLVGGASPLVAGVTLAAITGGKERIREWWWWLPSIILHTLLIVWVYNETNRSILAVILFHGMMNLTGEFLGLASEMFPFLLLGNLLAATFLVLTWRRSGYSLLPPKKD